MHQQTITYEPVFLANAALGGRGESISFEQARPFFLQNREWFRANWRTGAEAPRSDFGAGIEDAFLCVCGRKLPVLIAQVDHVVSQTHLRNGGDLVEVVERTARRLLPEALTKEVAFLVTRAGGVQSARVKYLVYASANQTDQASPLETGRVAGAIPLPAPGQSTSALPPLPSSGAFVSAGHSAFWVQAYADVPLNANQGGGGVMPAPHGRPRPGLATGQVSRGEAYFEYKTWAGAQTRIRRCRVGSDGAKALTSEDAPLTLGALLATDLTNFQLLCGHCNTSKGGDTFRYQRSRPASEIFRGA